MDTETNKLAAILHVSLLAGHLIPLGGFLIPLIIWQMKKETVPGIDAHGREAMNWIISVFIYYAGLTVLSLFFLFVFKPAMLLAFGLMGLLALVGMVFPIIGAIKASEGEVWRYPGGMTFL